MIDRLQARGLRDGSAAAKAAVAAGSALDDPAYRQAYDAGYKAALGTWGRLYGKSDAAKAAGLARYARESAERDAKERTEHPERFYSDGTRRS